MHLILIDLKPEELDRKSKNLGLHTHQSLLIQKLCGAFKHPKTLPATYFISPDGEIVFASLKPQDEASLSLVYEDLQNGV